MKYYNKINLHFTDICNYNCSFCFAKKENQVVDIQTFMKQVDACSCYFKRNNISNPMINLVGGEPLTYNHLDEIITHINKKKISCSLVTNGLLLEESFLKKHVKEIDTIGISIDSLNDATNKLIGRCTLSGRYLTKDGYLEKCKLILKYGYKLKINVCVSKLNYQEVRSFKEFFNHFKDQNNIRIKLMKMVIVSNRNSGSKSNELTDEEFISFCNEFKNYKVEIEDDKTMFTKYLMVNSSSNVIVNDYEGTDVIVGNLLENPLYLDVGVNCIISTKNILSKRYDNRRYYKVDTLIGHVGGNNFSIQPLAIAARNKKEASELARRTPRVKHDNKQVIKGIEEITREEFNRLYFTTSMNPFFVCKNAHEQMSFEKPLIKVERKRGRPKKNTKKESSSYKKQKSLIIVKSKNMEIKEYQNSLGYYQNF